MTAQVFRRFKIAVLIVIFFIVALHILSLEGVLVGMNKPIHAREFAYETMQDKYNVTIISKEKFRMDGLTALWVKDSNGINYRAENYWLFREIKEGHTYDIRYTAGFFNEVWEIREV